MVSDWIEVSGVIVKGHRVASQPSRDYPYPTLEKQRPHFLERGLDLSPYYLGTLNISIAPAEFGMIHPAITFPLVAWTDLHPPETFSFSPCKLIFQARVYEGIVYYPHPETKIRNFQDPSLIEVLAEKIPNLKYGDPIQLLLNPKEISVK